MPVRLVVGTQWGDEGKGKIVDLLSESADIIARYQGGHNAGHTVVVGDDEYILHLIPSGILHPGKICVIGNGVVVDPSALLSEVSMLREKGVDVDGNLFLSKRASLIMPYHKRIDMSMESLKGGKKIGTTGRGIGPAYTDKSGRLGIHVADLFSPDLFREKLGLNIEQKNIVMRELFNGKEFDLEQIFSEYMGYKEKIEKFVVDTKWLLRDAFKSGKNILVEGAQGAMLDVDFGTYPFVTSSNTTVGGACTGLGIPAKSIENVLGIVKAYTTRVGEGPFPTELHDRDGEMLAKEGGEFGSTTGRARRCGWLDMVVLKYSCWLNGIDSLAITKLDVLDKFEKIKICTGYMYKGKLVSDMPDEIEILENGTPVYREFDGWKESSRGIECFDELPDNAKRYVEIIQELAETSVSIVSTGKRRSETICL